ncbi:MAG: S9 family peptidase [Acidobacteriota bacterium]|nr:S9 family peptidase [Acidobacteriota bacterium]
MKKIYRLFIALFVFSAVAQAQEKLLTIDEIYGDRATRVAFGGTSMNLRWNKDGSLRQVRAGKNGAEVYRFNAQTGEAIPFYDKSKLEEALLPLGVKAEQVNQISSQPLETLNNTETAAIISSGNDLYLYNLTSGAAKRLTNSADEELEPAFSPDGKMVSFVRGMNLFVVDVATGREKQLTRDGGEKILNGYLDWVYEEELYGRGNKRGYWWSPDSKYIAFLRTDENPVPKFLLVDHIPTDQRIEDTDYPQAGDPNPLVTLGIADVTKNSLVPNVTKIPKIGNRLPASVARFGDAVKFVDLSKYKPEDFLISRVAWSPNSQTVVFQAQNREQTFLDLNAASVGGGKITTILREASPTWVEVIDNPVYLTDGSFVWQSARSGFRHLYHVDKNGGIIKQITDGKWEVHDFYGVDEPNGYAYFSAAGEHSWIADDIYRVRLDGSGLTRLSQMEGSHRAEFSPNFSQFVDTWSDINTPPQTRLFKSDGTLLKVLNENPIDVLKDYKLGKPQFLNVKTRDGFNMEAMMILPPDFDSSKKYPVMAFTYSGPHAPQVRNSWGGNAGMFKQLLAEKGYVIWVCDNRTASGKGVESERPVYENFGELELRDLTDGFNYLKSQSFVDPSRIGMYGWSFGGFMTSYTMTHSDILKMGIAGGLVGDWSLYDSIYTERYMQTPKDNPNGYKKSSVIGAAKNLNGRILIVHGTMDNNVHMQNAMQFVYELQKAGKQFDLMVYPTQRHGVSNPLQVKHLNQMILDYILKNL